MRRLPRNYSCCLLPLPIFPFLLLFVKLSECGLLMAFAIALQLVRLTDPFVGELSRIFVLISSKFTGMIHM